MDKASLPLRPVPEDRAEVRALAAALLRRRLPEPLSFRGALRRELQP